MAEHFKILSKSKDGVQIEIVVDGETKLVHYNYLVTEEELLKSVEHEINIMKDENDPNPTLTPVIGKEMEVVKIQVEDPETHEISDVYSMKEKEVVKL